MKDGVMSMRPVADGIKIPPGGTVTLAPDGFHIMFVTLKGTLKEGGQAAGRPDLREGGKRHHLSARPRHRCHQLRDDGQYEDGRHDAEWRELSERHRGNPVRSPQRLFADRLIAPSVLLPLAAVRR
jgi:hypothetical protein